MLQALRIRCLAPFLLATACHTTQSPTPTSAERALAERVAGCYALAFGPTEASAAARPGAARVNLPSHAYVELLGPSPRLTYGQLPARPTLDSAITDYVRPAWVPRAPDSVDVFWMHARTPVLALQATLVVRADSLVGLIDVESDLRSARAQPSLATVIARRTPCRSAARAPEAPNNALQRTGDVAIARTSGARNLL